MTHSLLRSKDRSILLLAILAIGCACLLTGCSKWQFPGFMAKDEINEESVQVRLSLDKGTYRPGDMVTAKVELINRTNKTLIVAMPCSAKLESESNITFWMFNNNEKSMLRQVPVVPEGRTVVPPPVRLFPGQTQERQFCFVRSSVVAGKHLLQAKYTGTWGIDGGDIGPMLISNDVNYTVGGKRVWERDEDGVLRKTSAIEIAKKKYGRSVRRADARLIRNEAGILDWWVTLEKTPVDTETDGKDRVAYLVSPYNCSIRQKMKPDPKAFSKTEDVDADEVSEVR
jgi:hypothetical protein